MCVYILACMFLHTLFLPDVPLLNIKTHHLIILYHFLRVFKIIFSEQINSRYFLTSLYSLQSFYNDVYVYLSLFTSSCHLGTMPALCTNSWQCLYFYKKEFTCTHETIYASQRVHKIVVNVHVACYQIKKHTILCKTNTLQTELFLRKKHAQTYTHKHTHKITHRAHFYIDGIN